MSSEMVSKFRMASYIQFLWQPLNIVITILCLSKGVGYSTALVHASILIISSLLIYITEITYKFSLN